MENDLKMDQQSIDSRLPKPSNGSGIHSNGDSDRPEKVLVYLGPSLSLVRARAILPGAIYKPPCRQGDIVTDVVYENPTHILLIDGTFRDNLSPWHKELVFALQCPGVKAIYGAASMGALRAAELDWLGMVGVGQVYEWYRDRVTEDDSEVAVSYAELANGDYKCLTVPLVDIRAGVEAYQRQYPGTAIAEGAESFLETMAKVFYMERTSQICEEAWEKLELDVPWPYVALKSFDAVKLLNDFRAYQPAPIKAPRPENLSPFFQALYERDRRVRINGQEVPQQHIDAYVMLHNPEYERIAWDSANQELALLLCDYLCILTDHDEVGRESARFQTRAGIKTSADFEAFLENNGWTAPEFNRLMIQNARIRKLQHALAVTKTYRRNTQSVLDYLRTHQGFDYWAIQVAQAEAQIRASGVDDWLAINLETPAFVALKRHYDEEGLELHASPEDYLLETGFSNPTELGVALSRIAALRKEKENG